MWLIHVLVMKQSLFLIKCSQMFISSDSKAHSEMLRCVKIRWVIRAQYINLSTTLDEQTKMCLLILTMFFFFMYTAV